MNTMHETGEADADSGPGHTAEQLRLVRQQLAARDLQLDQLQQELEARDERLVELRQANRTSAGAHQELEGEVAALRTQVATLSALQQTVPAEREEQREREQDLEKRNLDLERQAAALEGALRARRGEAEELRAESSTLRAELIASQERLSHAEEALEGCKAKVSHAQQVRAADQADAEGRLALKLEQLRRELTGETECEQAKTREAEHALQESVERREEVEKEVVALRRQVEDLKQSALEMAQDRQAVQRTTEAAQQKMEAELLSLRAKLEEEEMAAAAAVAGREAAEEELQRELESVEARVESGRLQAQQALDDLSTMRSQIKDKDSTLDSRWAEVEELRATLKEANLLNAKLQGEGQGLRELLSSLREQKTEAEEHAKSLSDKLLALNTEAAQAKATGAAAVARAEAAGEKMRTLSEACEKLEKARAAAVHEHSVQDKRAAELEGQVRQLEADKGHALENYSAAVAAAKTAADLNSKSAQERSQALAGLQSQLSTSQARVDELEQRLKRQGWELQDVSVSGERQMERLQSMLEAKTGECEAQARDLERLRQEVEAGLDRLTREALEAEQERGKVLKRASRAEAQVQAVQKELLDLTCDGLRMREEHEAATAAAAEQGETLRERLRASQEQVQEERNERKEIQQQLRAVNRTAADVVSARTDARVAEARAMSVEKETLSAVELLERVCASLSASLAAHRADATQLDACQQRLIIVESELLALRAGELAAYDKAAASDDKLTAALEEGALKDARADGLQMQLDAQKVVESSQLLQIAALEEERGTLQAIQRQSEQQVQDLHTQLMLCKGNATYHDQARILKTCVPPPLTSYSPCVLTFKNVLCTRNTCLRVSRKRTARVRISPSQRRRPRMSSRPCATLLRSCRKRKKRRRSWRRRTRLSSSRSLRCSRSSAPAKSSSATSPRSWLWRWTSLLATGSTTPSRPVRGLVGVETGRWGD